jgi:LysR family transcriptional regulator, benzoate and cis,cis-muconate-responsive activator of ben and cat genes
MRIPSLTIDVLVAVIALVERGTFELAGRELTISASAVHKRIRTAEMQMGQRLFVASDEGMMLTKEGRVFYPDAIRAVEQILLVEEKTRSVIDLEAGRLRIGHSTFLPPKLLSFVMKLDLEQPQGIHIEHFPGLTASLTDRVVEGTLHAAFGDLPVSHPALISRQLLEEPMVVCMPRSHPLAVRPVVRPQDLNEAPVIAVSREPSPMQHSEIEEYFEGFGVHFNVVADAFGPHEALSMVEQNIGLTLLGASAAKNPSIIAKPLSIKTLTCKSGIFVREDNRHPSLNELIERVLRSPLHEENRSVSPLSVPLRKKRLVKSS